MAEPEKIAVTRRLLAVWFLTLTCAILSGLVAVFVPTWIHVTSNSTSSNQQDYWITPGGEQDLRINMYSDIGFWEQCVNTRYSSDNGSHWNSAFNCTQINQAMLADWFQNVEVLSVTGVVLCCCAVAGLCALLVFSNCRLVYVITPHTTLAVVVTSASLLGGLLQLAGAVLCGVESHRDVLPVCITWCPDDMQPLASCVTNATVTSSCNVHLGSGYIMGVTSVGFGLLSAAIAVGVVCLARSRGNPDEDESLLNEDINSPVENVGNNDVLPVTP